ncbi:MAG: 30S ribosomal protein S6 [Sphingomonadaceae bacterium]|uniref:30S ribosomal protein S6 n=1 Tax=Thermaurantiacus sp. TaxID=2820283 RepID=UPI00298F052B|nr:30S ribosomal protein S6 [Thermaurantiacus sp.]MCS6987121.1 30S ribosomal protein S6 [Sphingomonadaceae bacterium]MDW8415846.1 30S ribosomal protein S6 [Thermaurantiacus sp.]
MPLYEHVYLARPDLAPAQVEALTQALAKVVSDHHGTVRGTEYWGLRNLAYRIRKNRKAHYVLMNIDAPAEAIHELERQVRINEDVLRHLTVRVDAFDEDGSAMVRKGDRDRRRREEGGW